MGGGNGGGEKIFPKFKVWKRYCPKFKVWKKDIKGGGRLAI